MVGFEGVWYWRRFLVWVCICGDLRLCWQVLGAVGFLWYGMSGVVFDLVLLGVLGIVVLWYLIYCCLWLCWLFALLCGICFVVWVFCLLLLALIVLIIALDIRSVSFCRCYLFVVVICVLIVFVVLGTC